jgi:hypothetical protein
VPLEPARPHELPSRLPNYVPPQYGTKPGGRPCEQPLSKNMLPSTVTNVRLRALLTVLTLTLLGSVACTSGTAGLGPTYFQPSRITVQDFSVQPAEPAAGVPVRIQFRLVRAGDDGSPIYWTSHLIERPAIGGTLSRFSGGPVASGSAIEIVYTTDAPTVAYVSIYPASVAGKETGDGSGDWISMPIRVR